MNVKNWIGVVFLGIVFSIATEGCYYDKAELLYPQPACDSSTATYSTAVAAVLSQHCNSCHGGTASSGGGVPLDNYASVKIYVDNGKLIGTISQGSGFDAMPKGASKIDDCSIGKIQHWIATGAPNN